MPPGRRRRPPLSGFVSSNGYVCICLRGRFVRLSRLVMEIVLGHPLEPGQDVHHRDGNKLNNCPHNLELQEHGNHVWGHKRTLPLLGRCEQCGIPYHWRLRYGKRQRFCSRACVIAARRRETPQPPLDPFLRDLVLLSDHPAARHHKAKHEVVRSLVCRCSAEVRRSATAKPESSSVCGNGASPVPPHPSPLPWGEGEPSPVGRQVEGRWDLREPCSGAPSPQGRGLG